MGKKEASGSVKGPLRVCLGGGKRTDASWCPFDTEGVRGGTRVTPRVASGGEIGAKRRCSVLTLEKREKKEGGTVICSEMRGEDRNPPPQGE